MFFCRFNLHGLFLECKRVEEKVSFSSLAGMVTSYILILVVVKPTYTRVDIHRTPHLRFVHFTVCVCYTVLKMSKGGWHAPLSLWPCCGLLEACTLQGDLLLPLLWVCQRSWLSHLATGLCKVPTLWERKMRHKETNLLLRCEAEFPLTPSLNSLHLTPSVKWESASLTVSNSCHLNTGVDLDCFSAFWLRQSVMINLEMPFMI